MAYEPPRTFSQQYGPPDAFRTSFRNSVRYESQNDILEDYSYHDKEDPYSATNKIESSHSNNGFMVWLFRSPCPDWNWFLGWSGWSALLAFVILAIMIAILVLVAVGDNANISPIPVPSPKTKPCNPENRALGGPCPEIPECCTVAGCNPMPPYAIGCEVDLVLVGCGTSALTFLNRITNYVSLQGKRFSAICVEMGEINNEDPYVYKVWQNDVPYWLFPDLYAKYTTTLQFDFPTLTGIVGSYGRSFSGSSSHDYNVLVFPTPLLMNEIDEILEGNTVWTYSNVISTIRSLENYHGSTDCTRGYAGKMNIEQLNYTGDSDSFMFQMMNLTALYSPNSMDNNVVQAIDYNCPSAELYWSTELEMYWKKISNTYYDRSFPGIDFFGPDDMDQTTGIGIGEKKFGAVMGAMVDRVDVNSTGHAYRVRSFVNGREFFYYARNIIGLAAGAISTPGILERSGIGDPEVLTPLGIPIVKSLSEVGNNFQTHCGSLFIISTNATLPSSGFGMGVGNAGFAMLPELGGLRSVQILELDPTREVGFLKSRVLASYILGNLGELPEGWKYVAYLVTVVHPASVGSVHINSDQPAVPPSILTGTYTDSTDRDLRVMVATMQSLYAAFNEFTLNGTDTTDHYELLYPLPEVMGNVTKLAQSIVDYPVCQNHYSSTTSMGTVLDKNLNVKGIKSLKVIDCSAWPIINNGNTRSQAIITGAIAAEDFLNNFSPQ